MGFGVEFTRQRLSRCLTEPIQRALSLQCLPDSAIAFVDRIDVGTEVGFASPPGAPDLVEATLPVAIHFVSMADLLAHPNQSPPELPTTRADVALRVQLQAQGTALAVAVLPPDVSGSGIPSPLREQIAQQLANAANGALNNAGFDLAPMIDGFGLPPPTVARVVLTPATLVVEYDPLGPSGNRLGVGQSWGFFLDVQPLLDFALDKLPPEVRSGLVSTSAQWSPDGTVPRIVAQAKLDLGLFQIKLPLDIRLSLLPGAPAQLRVDLTWDVEVDALTVMGIPLAWLIKLAGLPGMAAALASEGFAEVIELGLDGAAALADDKIAAAFAQAGAERTGPRSYARLQALPPLQLLGVELRTESLIASGAGMTIGGPVLVQAVSREPMSLSTTRFGRPFFASNCRQTGGVRPTVRAEQVRYFASANFYEMGRFCSARLVPMNATAARLMEPSLDGATAATEAFGFDLDLQEANLITTDVRMLVRTSRGTRLVDFGKPTPAVVDANGNVSNVIGHIWNCLTYSTEDKHALIFGNDPLHLTREDVLPPLEDPGWTRLLREAWGLDVHLVEVSGLEPGEMVVYESATHRVQVTADREGRAVLPGFSPLGADVKPARLLRLNQGPLTQREVRLLAGTALQGGAMLRPPAEGEVMVDGGGLQRRAAWGEALRSMHIGPAFMGALRAQDPGVLAGLNPQPLPPGPPPELGALNPQPLPPEPPPHENPLVQATGLKGVRAVLAVPGASPDQMVIAMMQDGRKVVLDGHAGRPRVTGTVDGPLGRTLFKGGFAVAQAGGHLRLFEVR
jgi:hypothetical protein